MRAMYRFPLKISGKLYSWSQRCLQTHGLFDDALRGWILKFFQHCFSLAGSWSPWTFIIFNWRYTGLKTWIQTNKLRGLSPRANCTDRATAACRPTFADRGCRVVNVTDPYGRILGFLDRCRYFFFQAAPQLYSWGWVVPVSDPLLIRKSGSAWNRTRTFGSLTRNSDHKTTGVLETWMPLKNHCAL
jgi:hypothetical protein